MESEDIAAAAVASITTVSVLTIFHKKKQKFSKEEIDLLDEEADFAVEDADIA
jgi:hypothetical protein